MLFLIDEQLPPRLAPWLHDRGHQAIHVLDLELGGQSDRLVMAAAIEMRAVLITKDVDFSFGMSARAPVLWLRFGNIGTTAMLLKLALVINEAVIALEQGDHLVELR